MSLRTVGKSGPPPSAFEAGSLPMREKERLCRDLLEEFGLLVHTHYAGRHELIIECDLGEHKRQKAEPTGALNYDKLTFKCLGCGRGYGLLAFIAAHRGEDSADARKWLAKETGTDGQVQDLDAILRYFDALYGPKAEKVPLPSYSPRVLEPWEDLMHPWLTDPPEEGGRGIPEANLERFRVGYAPEFKYAMRDDKSWMTSERIVIPHFWKGDLVGWQSRRLDARDGTAKYKSSTDFPKDTTLFNYKPKEESTCIVVEGMFSVIAHDHHTHMVATFGANLTDAQIRLLSRYRKVIFWLDNDSAGWTEYLGLFDKYGRQTKMGVLETLSKFTDVWAVDSDINADPADLDEGTVMHYKETAVPWVIWSKPKRLRCYRCHETAHEGTC